MGGQGGQQLPGAQEGEGGVVDRDSGLEAGLQRPRGADLLPDALDFHGERPVQPVGPLLSRRGQAETPGPPLSQLGQRPHRRQAGVARAGLRRRLGVGRGARADRAPRPGGDLRRRPPRVGDRPG